METMMTVSEAAERLRLGKSTVYELIHQGVLPSLRIGRSIRIPVDALQLWMNSQVRSALGPSGSQDSSGVEAHE